MYVGPVADALGGADTSAIFGPVVGAGVYAALFTTVYRRQLAVDRIAAGRRPRHRTPTPERTG
ncbi:hypothetical protein [Streptodolium elevatio]